VHCLYRLLRPVCTGYCALLVTVTMHCLYRLLCTVCTGYCALSEPVIFCCLCTLCTGYFPLPVQLTAIGPQVSNKTVQWIWYWMTAVPVFSPGFRLGWNPDETRQERKSIARFPPNFPPANRHSTLVHTRLKPTKRSEQLCYTPVQLLAFCVSSIYEGRPRCEDTRYKGTQCMRVWRNNEPRSHNHCCSGKALVLQILSVCLQPYVSSMQCACAILPSVACPALQYFYTLSHKRHDFREKKVTENKMCVLVSLQLLSKHFSL
jgi:hypothetical protein